MIKKVRARYKKWKGWRRYTSLSKFDQILVLLDLKRNVHFEMYKDSFHGFLD